MLRFPWQLAWAHLRRRKTQNLLSILGVAVGVMVVTTAMSLTNGFVDALIQTTTRALPHLDVQSYEINSGGAAPNGPLERWLNEHQDVLGWGPYLRAQGLVSRRASSGRGGALSYAQIFGVNPGLEGTALNLDGPTKRLLETLPEDGILLGDQLAASIGAFPGDQLIVSVPEGMDISNLKRRPFKLHGTFRTGNYIIDIGNAFVPLRALQEQQSLTGKISGYHVKLRNPQEATLRALELPRELKFSGQPWQALNGTLLEQMALQKMVITVVLLLMVLVAVLGMVNTLVLSVLEKTPEIAILRAIGASARSISLIYLLEGLVLGATGVLFGVLLGVLLCAYFQWRPLEIPGGLYFITALSTKIQVADFVLVGVCAFVITVLAALMPARRAAAIEPARIIR